MYVNQHTKLQIQLYSVWIFDRMKHFSYLIYCISILPIRYSQHVITPSRYLPKIFRGYLTLDSYLVPEGQTMYTKQKCHDGLKGACFELVNAAGQAEVSK